MAKLAPSQGAPEAGATELKPCPFCGGKADRMREWSGRLSTMICCVDATCFGRHYEQDEQGGWNHDRSLDESVAAWNRRAASPSPPPGVGEDPFETRPWVVRVGEVLDEGDGFWRSCSGCHELNDGAPTGDYSAAFRTHVGLGCSECGGLGVVWDDTDYAAMAADLAAPPAGVDVVKLASLLKAAEPFIAYASLSGFERMPADMPITAGSRLAARQLTAGDLRTLVDALARLGAAP